jgi:hypothetical protein
VDQVQQVRAQEHGGEQYEVRIQKHFQEMMSRLGYQGLCAANQGSFQFLVGLGDQYTPL